MRRLDVLWIDEAPSIMAAQQDEHRAAIRAWLLQLMGERSIPSPAELSRVAGVARNTIYRALAPDGDFVMSTRTVARIRDALDATPPPTHAPSLTRGLAETEAEQYEAPPQSADPCAGGNERHVWRLKNRALELAGCLPGDLLTVDFTAAPAEGDVVCAQLYDFERGTAETVFRLYEPPYLVAASMERKPAFRPILLDGGRALLRGVVVELRRVRAPEERRDAVETESDRSINEPVAFHK